VKVYTLRETEAFIADLRRIGEHLDWTTGDPDKTDDILMDFRTTTNGLTEFPNRFVERRDLGEGIRLCVVRKKGILLFQVDEQTQVVRVLRAFYGGEDYGALFHGDNEG